MENNNKITLVIGHSFTMDGVNDIRGFDEGDVSLDTKSGKITVEGKDLKIESLSKEDGHIFVSGDISGVFCDREVEKSKGLIKRMLGR